MNNNPSIGLWLHWIGKFDQCENFRWDFPFRERFLLEIDSMEYLWIKDNFDKTMNGHYVWLSKNISILLIFPSFFSRKNSYPSNVFKISCSSNNFVYHTMILLSDTTRKIMEPCVFSIMVVLIQLQTKLLNEVLIEVIVACMVRFLFYSSLWQTSNFRMYLWSRSLFLS